MAQKDDLMTNAALIVAAGRGSRMRQDMPKQYLSLGGHAVLWHTVQAFLASDRIDTVRVVIHPDDRALYDHAVAGITDARLEAPVPGAPRGQPRCGWGWRHCRRRCRRMF